MGGQCRRGPVSIETNNAFLDSDRERTFLDRPRRTHIDFFLPKARPCWIWDLHRVMNIIPFQKMQNAKDCFGEEAHRDVLHPQFFMESLREAAWNFTRV